MRYTAAVDHDLCQGHGQCQEVAPAYFEVRDDGFAYVLREVDSAEGLERVQDAASRCPAEAISITRVDSNGGV
jgi:Ferredoxin